MGYKLNILPGSTDKTGWFKSQPYSIGQIQKIPIDGGGLGDSLNSIPSPFARMHLFDAAFQFVYQDSVEQDPKMKLAGDTYHKIVSDCLDIFELMYYWHAHQQENKPLDLVFWKKEDELKELGESKRENHGLLANVLDTFLNSDPSFSDFKECLIIKYDGEVIAGSSPFTGFFTTPDSLLNFPLLKPLSRKAYFSINIPFSERTPEIQYYIKEFFQRYTSDAAQSVRVYLQRFKIPSEVKAPLIPLRHKGIAIHALGQQLYTATEVGSELFEPCLIKVDYRLNDRCFYLPKNAYYDRFYDYLLPLSPAFFAKFKPEDIPSIVSINELSPDSVEVTITPKGGENSPPGKPISKTYDKNPQIDRFGKLVELKEIHQINFNLGIFPFLKVMDQPDGPEGFNNFYRVTTMIEDKSRLYDNKDFELSFYKDKDLLQNGDVTRQSRTDRSFLSENKLVGSTYYALNTAFDFIQVKFPDLEKGIPIAGTIVPHWVEKKSGEKAMDFAIDFGTTSTFVAWTTDPTHNEEPRALEFDEKESPVALLNKLREKKENSITAVYELFPAFTESIEMQKREFVPGIMKRGEKYQFPIRTVLFQQEGLSGGKKSVLENANICFAYQKKKSATIDYTGQEYAVNLKWKINSVGDVKDGVRVFIEELFLLIRTKILLNEGDPRKSNIYWFYPLSFTPAMQVEYTKLWHRCSQKYLRTAEGNIHSLTESEAPFHFLFNEATVRNPDSVLTLDIGGGSTDIMYFKEKQAMFGTSVYFGANVLWGNGYGFEGRKENGIYLALKQMVSGKLEDPPLIDLNNEYCSNENRKVGSDEIINFWIANDDETQVLDLLRHGDYKFSYLLHLSALIYHALRLLKINDGAPPTTVIFSGNGSKYIDLIHEPAAIGRIWGYFGRKIFGEHVKDPLVVLPAKDRKEATCYGGLSMTSKPSKIEIRNYLGFEQPDEKSGITYGQLATDKEEYFNRLMSTFTEFVDWFFGMNQVPGLNFRREFGIEKKVEPLRKFLLEKAAENLSQGYIKRTEDITPDDHISDSLFFYPLVGLIFHVNNLTADEIYNFTEKTERFARSAEGDREFDVNRLTAERRNDSNFVITYENTNPDFARITIIDDPEVHKNLIAMYDSYLTSVCEYDKPPGKAEAIRVLKPGKATKQGNSWILDEKIKIEFI